MKVLAFGASSSKNSINQKLAKYTAQLIRNAEYRFLDLNDYEMPIFSVDKEHEIGIPVLAYQFLDELNGADIIVISMAEHNGAYSAAFKNIFDWASRANLKMFESKKMILLSTSPGPRGGQNVLEIAADRFPRHGAEILFTFSLPLFGQNFDQIMVMKK